ncbi:hypothetical protein [Methylobacterium sp. JK268]
MPRASGPSEVAFASAEFLRLIAASGLSLSTIRRLAVAALHRAGGGFLPVGSGTIAVQRA